MLTNTLFCCSFPQYGNHTRATHIWGCFCFPSLVVSCIGCVSVCLVVMLLFLLLTLQSYTWLTSDLEREGRGGVSVWVNEWDQKQGKVQEVMRSTRGSQSVSPCVKCSCLSPTCHLIHTPVWSILKARQWYGTNNLITVSISFICLSFSELIPSHFFLKHNFFSSLSPFLVLLWLAILKILLA